MCVIIRCVPGWWLNGMNGRIKDGLILTNRVAMSAPPPRQQAQLQIVPSVITQLPRQQAQLQ